MQLDPAAAGFRLLAHETLTSTNAEALALARAGEPGALWITARAQTAGRGRRGNRWVSEPGNLYATLLLIDPAPPARAPELSFVAALAVFEAIADGATALREELTLKWPNDVLCRGEKVAGILIEGEVVQSKLAVAIGVGVNCLNHPGGTSFPATDLARAGARISADDLFRALSRSMARRLEEWAHGFRSIRAAWLAHAAGLGEELNVRLPGRELHGRFEALDDRGRLMLRRADGSLEAIAAGEVFPVARSVA